MQIKTLNTIKIFIISTLLLASGSFIGCTAGETNAAADSITLRINEYQIHNEKTLRDSAWNTPDWIEIYNYGTESIWLGDKYLSDDSNNPLKSQLPDIYIDAGCYVLVYASSENNSAEYEIHANFKLSDDDEQIYLAASGEIIDYCDIDDLPVDISAGFNEKGSWVYFATPSPGIANIGKGSKSMDIEPEYVEVLPIIINEYMSSNKYTLRDDAKNSPDWIEIYNPNEDSIDLSNYYISDDISKKCKCRLPEYTLEAGDYLVIYASGETETQVDGIYLPFSIGEDDENIVISAYTGVQIDMCTVDALPQDISAGVSKDGEWAYFAKATPGTENAEDASDTYSIEPIRTAESGILINEMMPNNKYGIVDSYGDTSDWIELYNPGDEDISLEDFAITDNYEVLDKWIFPDDAIIEAKGYLLVFLSGREQSVGELHAGFAIGEEDEKIYLVEPNGAIASYMDAEQLPGNVSKGRLESGEYGYFTLPTPGSENIGFYETEMMVDEDILLSDVYISEVSSGSYDYYNTGYNFYEEYIEIHNKGHDAMELSGYTLMAGSQQWEFPQKIISAGGYLVVQLKGAASADSSIVPSDLAISAAGECIQLKNTEGIIIDSFETGYLTGDVSSGRIEGQGSSRYFFAEKTPNEKNSTIAYVSYCSEPVFSESGGMVEAESIILRITCKEGETIRYTTDGSKPTEKSEIYTSPILLDSDIVVRASAYSEDKLPSSAVTRTFIFEREHSLPIICLSSDNANLFGDTRGIYANGKEYIEDENPHYSANYWRDWECETSFEYYNENNYLALDFDAGLQIAGQYSREYGQKSLVVRVRDEYGTGEIYFPFFENELAQEHKHLLLRNSGQDIVYTKIKDYFIHQSVKGYSDIDIMDGRPVVVYINGRYWGLYNLREKQNEDYLASRYNIDSDNVTIIKSVNSLIAGNTSEWNQLRLFIERNSFQDDKMYEKLSEMVDVDVFIDYIIIQTFYGNYDIGNVKYWKENGSGKWKPMLYDTDMALTMETSQINYIDVYFRDNDYTTIFRALFENQNFKDAFVERYAYFLNEVFTEERLFEMIDDMAAEIDSEIYYQDERFNTPSSYEKWRTNIDAMKSIISDRRQLTVQHLQVVFALSDDEVERLFN